jgi:hypothetical protein
VINLIYRALDGNGDFTMGKTAKTYVSGVYAVAQAVQTRLLLLQGEWWEDTADGLPLFQQILNQPGSDKQLSAIDLLIKDRILGTAGVRNIASYNRTYVNRRYSFDCIINTIYGQTSVVSTLGVS